MTTLTAQVRKILRETGAAHPYGMWNNRYKSCRTVKCYGVDDNDIIADAAEQIKQLCLNNNIQFDMKVIENADWRGSMRSVIVRLPLED